MCSVRGVGGGRGGSSLQEATFGVGGMRQYVFSNQTDNSHLQLKDSLGEGDMKKHSLMGPWTDRTMLNLEGSRG